MDDYLKWIGTRWEARCQMRLPKGNVGVGDTFTYDAACAALRLDPISWELIGNAVQLAAPPRLSDTVAGKAKGRRGDGFTFTSSPLDVTAADDLPIAAPATADDAAPDAAEVDD